MNGDYNVGLTYASLNGLDVRKKNIYWALMTAAFDVIKKKVIL